MKKLLAILVLLAMSGCMTEREQMVHDFARNLLDADTPIFYLPEGVVVVCREEHQKIIVITPDGEMMEAGALIVPTGGLMVPNKLAAAAARAAVRKSFTRKEERDGE